MKRVRFFWAAISKMHFPASVLPTLRYKCAPQKPQSHPCPQAAFIKGEIGGRAGVGS